MVTVQPILRAEEKEIVGKLGTVKGRIIDSSNQTLPGASIYIERLHTGVTSDVNGYYTFSNLDPGTYKVKVTYVGYAAAETTLTIKAGKTVEKDFMLNEGVELQEVVVGGAFQGQPVPSAHKSPCWAWATWSVRTRWASSPTPTSATH